MAVTFTETITNTAVIIFTRNSYIYIFMAFMVKCPVDHTIMTWILRLTMAGGAIELRHHHFGLPCHRVCVTVVAVTREEAVRNGAATQLPPRNHWFEPTIGSR